MREPTKDELDAIVRELAPAFMLAHGGSVPNLVAAILEPMTVVRVVFEIGRAYGNAEMRGPVSVELTPEDV